MTMKIQNLISPIDTFTWPYNPTVFDDALTNNYTLKPYKYRKYHILNTGGGVSPLSLVLTGHMSGGSKQTNYVELRKHFQETLLLKKLYFDDEKFYIGIGRSIKQVNTGGRTNFVDYVANFEALIGILFGDTERTSGSNVGDVNTFVLEITGRVTNGGSVLYIKDLLGNRLDVPASALTTNQYFIYSFINLVHSGSGVYTTKYAYFGLQVHAGTTDSTDVYKLKDSSETFTSTVNEGDLIINTTDSTRADVIKVESDAELFISRDIMVSGENYKIYHQCNQVTATNEGIIQIPPGAAISSVVTSNMYSVTTKFRDGWSG